MVLHDGDCDVGDGSCGDMVVDGEGDMLMVTMVMMVVGTDVHDQGGHVGHDSDDGDDSSVAICNGGDGKGKKSGPLGLDYRESKRTI